MFSALLIVSANTGFVGSLGVPLVPLVRTSYGVSLGHAQWSATVALLVGAVATPLLGRLSNPRNARTVMLVAVGLMLGGCALAAPGWSFETLILGRGLQGVGMALTPLAITSARLALTQEHFDRSVGYLAVATVVGVGASFPLVTWVADRAGLHAAFGFGTLVSAITLLIAIAAIPDNPPEAPRANDRSRLDAVGAGALTLGVTATLLLISGTISTLALALAAIVTAGLSCIVLLWRESRHEAPFVELRVHLRRPHLTVNIIGMVVGLGAYAALALASLRIQAPTLTGYGLGRSAFVAGSMVVPFSVANVVSNRIAVALSPKVGAERVLALGCTVTTLGLVTLAVPVASLPMLAAVLCVVGLGAGAAFSITPAVISSLVPVHAMGGALSFNQLLRYLGFAGGGALAVAVLELLGESPTGHPTAAGHAVAALACALAPAAGAALWAATRNQGR